VHATSVTVILPHVVSHAALITARPTVTEQAQPMQLASVVVSQIGSILNEPGSLASTGEALSHSFSDDQKYESHPVKNESVPKCGMIAFGSVIYVNGNGNGNIR